MAVALLDALTASDIMGGIEVDWAGFASCQTAFLEGEMSLLRLDGFLWDVRSERTREHYGS